MADESLQEQLVAQLAEQTDALEGLAALLAVDQNPELVQVFRTKRMSHLSFCSMLLRSPSSRKDAISRWALLHLKLITLLLQLHRELLAGLQETQLALAEYNPSVSSGTQPTEPSSGMPAMHQLHRSASATGLDSTFSLLQRVEHQAYECSPVQVHSTKWPVVPWQASQSGQRPGYSAV